MAGAADTVEIPDSPFLSIGPSPSTSCSVAPRAIAILNGTLAAALGLGLRLWLVGLLLWHSAISLPSGRPGATRCSSR